MTNGTTFNGGLVQLCAGRDVAANVSAACDAITRAADAGADYVQTPENTNVIELRRARLLDSLATFDEARTLDIFSALAQKLGIWLHLGSLVVRLGADKTANRAHVIDPSGTLRATYDKIHMFDVDLANGERYRESAAYEAGTKACVVDLPWARLGIAICYDLRFPHLFRAQAEAGAQIISAPSAFTRQTGAAHWHVLQRARAIENGAFMISAAHGGKHESGRETYGHSIAVDPWGHVLSELGEAPGVTVVEIEIDKVSEARSRIPSLSHTRAFTLETTASEMERAS
ncbi:MAG: carbon-nitrogen hydrolase family protein [Pseudomonadota bacterium]